MDLLKLYNHGSEFLKKCPTLKKFHESISASIVEWTKNKKLVRFEHLRSSGATDDDIKKTTTFWFCIAGFFIVFGLLKYSISSILFSFIIAFVFYAIGVINLEALKIKPDSDAFLKQTKQVSVLPQISAPEKEPRKNPVKTPFWRVYDWVERIVIGGWVYLSLVYTDTLSNWLKEYHIWDYLPHEAGKVINLNEKEFVLFGIIFLSLAFSLLRGILKIISFISKNLFPKRDIREL